MFWTIIYVIIKKRCTFAHEYDFFAKKSYKFDLKGEMKMTVFRRSLNK